MAKRDKDTIFNEFLADLKALNPAVEGILADEKVSSKLRESVLARSEFSAEMDRLKADRQQLEAFHAKEREKVAGWEKYVGDIYKEHATLADRVKKYEDEFGALEDGVTAPTKPRGMSQEDFDKQLTAELGRREVAYMKFFNDLSDLKADHKERFKEKLDIEAVTKIAGEKGVPLDMAYNEYVKDRVAEQDKASLEAKLAEAREEGRRAAMTEHRLPMMSSEPAMTHVLDMKDVPRTSTDRVAAAINGFVNRK